jgi:hypothetical protein
MPFHTTRPWARANLAAFLLEIVQLAPEAEDDRAVAPSGPLRSVIRGCAGAPE